MDLDTPRRQLAKNETLDLIEDRVPRPTFHESWHRVADLTPRLRASIAIIRQHFRGERWHILEDPANGRFFRVNDPAYDFIARLDGRITVAHAWRETLERLGDDALTQPEAVGLLARLWHANLLWADLPPDTQAMFRRQRERRAREWRGYLSSLLFLRIPLFDPDRMLDRWTPIVSWLLSPIGAAGWIILLLIGVWHLIDRGQSLLQASSTILSGENLLPLYLTYAIIKTLHELGHAFACKTFGRRAGRGGEVHAIGVMFFLFLPIPYVDASSSWALRDRLQRIIVSAAGIIVELACAALAAVAWARTAEGTFAHDIARNTIFLAGISTVLFNGNPLLRYDGYYILSDLLSVPNLAQRSQEFLKFAVKRHAWGLRAAFNPARSPTEAAILAFFGLASGAYRILVCIGIALFIASQQLVLGGLILVYAAVVWLAMPMGRVLRYLLADSELDRTRGRALVATVGTLAVVLLPAATIPLPDYARAEGIAEPHAYEVIAARVDGFIESAAPTGAHAATDSPLIAQRNDNLARRLAVLDAEAERLRVSRALAFRDDPARAMQIDAHIAAMGEQRRRAESDLASLTIRPGVEGEWIAPDIARRIGAFARRGDRLGLVADLSRMQVRAVLDQRAAAIVIAESAPEIDLRASLRPQHRLAASLQRVLPAGQKRLPAPSLASVHGGETPTAPTDTEAATPTEEVFEAWINLPDDHGLLPGQRVVARFKLHSRPLLSQAWRALRQTLQEKFNI